MTGDTKNDLRRWLRLVEGREALDPTAQAKLVRAVARIAKTVLPKDSILFHVTDAVQSFDIPRGPAFFTTYETGRWKARGLHRAGHDPGVERTLRFRTVADVEMIDLTFHGQDNFERLCRAAFGGQSYYRPDLAEALRGLASGWMTGSEVMLVDPHSVLTPEKT
jgi:hypothetical protein